MRFLCLFLVLTCCSLACLAEEAPFSAEILFVKGDVQVSNDGEAFGQAEKGQPLDEGDSILTGDHSLAVVAFVDGSKLRVEANSEVEIKTLFDQVENQTVGETSLVLKMGQLFIDIVNKYSEPILNVLHKNVSMGVRGTRFFVGEDAADGNLWLSVDRGEVELSLSENTEKAEALEAGQGIVVEQGSTFTSPKRYAWAKDLRYEVDSNPSNFREMRQKRRAEFKQKREKWQANRKRLKQFRQKWKQRAERFKQKVSQLKSKRNELKQKKRQLHKRYKQLKRRKHRLQKKERRLKQAIKRYQQTGKGNGKQLNRKLKNLRSQKDALRHEANKLRSSKERLKGEARKQKHMRNQMKDSFKNNKRRFRREMKKVRKKFHQQNPPQE